MRKVQDKLTETTGTADQEPASAPAASALEQKRLTFAWLDGEAQNVSLDPSLFTLIILYSGMIL